MRYVWGINQGEKKTGKVYKTKQKKRPENSLDKNE